MIPLLRLLTLFEQFWSKKAFMPIPYGLLSEMLEGMGEWSVWLPLTKA